MNVTKETRNAGRKLLWLLVPLGMYVLFTVWHNWTKNQNVPEELIGEWRTSNPKYADRAFEIGLVNVSFGTGNGGVTTGFIQQIERAAENGKTLYTITYDDEGKMNQLSLYYESSRPATIRFKNQPGITWTQETGH